MALKRSAGLETVACSADGLAVDRSRCTCTARRTIRPPRGFRVHRLGTLTRRDCGEPDDGGVLRHRASRDPKPVPHRGRPDVRLHLPRHSAIVSWVTPEGRQAPFVAHTLPLRVDEQRLDLHASRQAERGGGHREDLSQPHWERDAIGERRRSSRATVAEKAPRPSGVLPPSTAAESYRELVDLSAAHSVRWAVETSSPTTLDPEPLDIEMLALIASMRHLLKQPDPSPLQQRSCCHHHSTPPQAVV